jgi:hypothetical protein
MSELSGLLDSLDEARRIASIDVDEPVYQRTRSGMQVAVEHAKQDVKRLQTEYEDSVLKHGVAIFMYGPNEKLDAFTQAVTNLKEAAVVDANEMVNRLVEAVEKTMGTSREFTVSQAQILSVRISDIIRELGLPVLRMIQINELPYLANQEDVTAFVRKVLATQVNATINLQYLKRSVAREAEKIRYKLSVAPVIILNADAEDIPMFGSMFGKGMARVTVSDDDNIDEEFIAKTFQEVQKSIKKNKQ